MKITYHLYNTFVIESGKKTLVIDPVGCAGLQDSGGRQNDRQSWRHAPAPSRMGVHRSARRAAETCNECGACAKVCPMDIRIPEYIKSGQRILSTECIFCLECTNVCPKGILDATFGLDVGNRELLNVRLPKAEVQHVAGTTSGEHHMDVKGEQ